MFGGEDVDLHLLVTFSGSLHLPCSNLRLGQLHGHMLFYR
jgi:hypothetical protein